MHRLKQQHGMTMIGWILFLALIIAISVPAIKIIPMYFNYLKVNNALKDLKTDLIILRKTATPAEIRKLLLTTFNDRILEEVTVDEITVSQGDHAYNVRIRHQFKEQMVGNWYIILIVDESVDVPMQQ